MKYFIKIFLYLLLFIVCDKNSFSQDIRGAVMQLQHLYSYKYEAIVYLYVDANANYYRPYLIIDWGIKKPAYFSHETILSNGLIKKVFVGTHTFPSVGYYKISCVDSFRIANINNIESSEIQSVKIETELVLSPFLGNFNNSPIIFNQQHNITSNEAVFIYNPNVLDPDGDSLSFELISCYSKSYYLPANTFIDSENGEIATSPDTIGFYAYAVKVKEWRTVNNNQPILVGSMIYDFSININSISAIENFNTERNILLLYPNPANSQLVVCWKTALQHNASIYISDVSGKTIKTIEITPGNKQVNIDVSDLSSGMYIIKLNSHDTNYVKKLLIQK